MYLPEQLIQLDQQLIGEIYLASAVIAQPESPVLGPDIFYDEELSDYYQADVWIASELHQQIGAYKTRGAVNFISKLTKDERECGIVTASAGNHAQGIALSARIANIACHVFMPKDTPEYKVERVAEFGGSLTKITRFGNDYDETQKAALEEASQSSAVFASPFNDRAVIAGQGTWGIEIIEKIPEADIVFSPVGGMGLFAGLSTAIKSRNPTTEMIAVEPSGAASLRHALIHGEVTALNKIDTFVDGAAVKKVGELPFKLASHLVSEVIGVSRHDIRRATTDLWERDDPIRAELAGALSVAGLKKYGHLLKGKKIVCLVTGGNLSPERYEKEVRLLAS